MSEAEQGYCEAAGMPSVETLNRAARELGNIYKEPRPHTMLENLRIRQEQLRKQLDDVEEAITLIEQNPDVQRIIDLVRHI